MLCEDMEVVTEMSASSPSSSYCYKETNFLNYLKIQIFAKKRRAGRGLIPPELLEMHAT